MSYDQDVLQRLKNSINSFLKTHAEFKGVLEGARLLLSLGFQLSELILADMSAMERVNHQLRDGHSDRIDEATKYLKQMIFRLRVSQKNFLTSPRTLVPLDERVSMLGIASLNRDFNEYREVARGNETVEALRAKFLVLVSKIEGFEADDSRSSQERIKQVQNPRPSVARKHDRKAERAERDRQLRNKMKGSTSGGGKKQKVGR
jgi:hypothetical protein